MQLGLGISPTQPYGVAVPAFTPASISGLQLWLDASDASTLFTDSAGTTPATADGDPVGCWRDKSGNGYHVTQTDGTAKPLRQNSAQNGRMAINFDGINDRLIRSSTFTLAQPFSVFIVLNNYSIVTAPVFIDSYDNVQCVIYNGSSFDNSGFLNLTAGASLSVKIASPTFPALIYAVFNGSSSKININNNSIANGNAGTNSLTGISLGNIRGNPNPVVSSYAFNGYYCELIIYNSELNLSSTNAVSNYLNSKWSIY